MCQAAHVLKHHLSQRAHTSHAARTPLAQQKMLQLARLSYLLMGIRWGVKLMVTCFPAASDKPCSISGMCLCLVTP